MAGLSIAFSLGIVVGRWGPAVWAWVAPRIWARAQKSVKELRDE